MMSEQQAPGTRRKSSPSASMVYSHKINNLEDPHGTKEEEINRIARRLSKARNRGEKAQVIVLRERLITKCMKFFYITGDNVAYREDCVIHEGHYSQVDETFMEALLKVADRYDSRYGLFTHMLRNKYALMRTDEAYKAADEDTRFGGGETGAPISLQGRARRNDDDSTTIEAITGEYDEEREDVGEEGTDAFNHDTIPAYEALEESGEIESHETQYAPEDSADAVDDAILLQTISLITGFLGKTGKAANEARKLYTKMFFSETLTRVTKTRAEGELAPIERRQSALFATVELPFQDTYTVDECRSVRQLWSTQFVEGVPAVRRPLNDDPNKFDAAPDFGWRIPARFYVAYLNQIGRAGSDALVSQQRANYENLLASLIVR